MEVTVEKMGDIAVVAVPVDELDAGNVQEFKNEVAPALESNAKVIFDLARLRFVDSSGLAAFLSCLRKLKAKGGDMKLCGMSRKIRHMFEIVRMHRVFDIFDTRDEAARSFQ